MNGLRILLADDDEDMLHVLTALLQADGYNIVGAVTSGEQLVEEALDKEPDLIITDVVMKGELSGIDAANQIYHTLPIPIIVLTGYSTADLVERGFESGIMAYLMKPATTEQVRATIYMAKRRNEELVNLRTETSNLKVALENQKKLTRAKGIMMDELGITEEEAHKRLQNQARDSGRKVAELVDAILTAADVYKPVKKKNGRH